MSIEARDESQSEEQLNVWQLLRKQNDAASYNETPELLDHNQRGSSSQFEPSNPK